MRFTFGVEVMVNESAARLNCTSLYKPVFTSVSMTD